MSTRSVPEHIIVGRLIKSAALFKIVPGGGDCGDGRRRCRSIDDGYKYIADKMDIWSAVSTRCTDTVDFCRIGRGLHNRINLIGCTHTLVCSSSSYLSLSAASNSSLMEERSGVLFTQPAVCTLKLRKDARFLPRIYNMHIGPCQCPYCVFLMY